MTDSTDMTATNHGAAHQSAASGAGLLHTANAGVVVERTATVAGGMAVQANLFARQVVETLNKAGTGVATAFVYDEAFGEQNRLHWLVQLNSMSDFEEVMTGVAGDRELWSTLFLPGSVRDCVMLPQFWGMYNTRVEGDAQKHSGLLEGSGPITGLPPAYHQTAVPFDRLLHSANSGVVVHRSGVLDYNFRSEGRQFARQVAESINSNVGDDVSVFVYEGAFGPADHLHWLIHMRSFEAYFRLLEMHVRNEDVRDLYFRELVSPEKGGGTWARMFLPGSLTDVAMTPQQWAPSSS